jgi:hypothetical protein
MIPNDLRIDPLLGPTFTLGEQAGDFMRVLIELHIAAKIIIAKIIIK